jgi:DASH complex subunit DAD1
MASTPGSGGRTASPTVFEQQRNELAREISMVRLPYICEGSRSVYLPVLMSISCKLKGMEQVLQNINRLNRNLESVIAVRAIP